MPDTVFSLILNYLRGAACLYGRIMLRQLFSIFSQQNPGLVSLERFCRLALDAQAPSEPFRIIGDDDIYRGDIPVADMDRWLVHRQYCYATWDELFTLELSQEGTDTHPFPRETYLSYADSRYIPDTPQINGLAYMLQEHSCGKLPITEILRNALLLARDDCDAVRFLAEMQRLGCRFGDLKDRLLAVRLYKAVFDTVPKPIHNGHSELELKVRGMTPRRYYLWFCPPKEDNGFFFCPDDLIADVPFTGETNHQVFLRRCLQEEQLPCRLFEPCFCGSGLFYADCCGIR